MIYNIIVLSIAVILDLVATRKLIRTARLLTQTKRLHIILVWLVPFVWALIVLLYSDEPPKKTKKFDRSRYMSSGYQQYSHHQSI